MKFGLFSLMPHREAAKPEAQVFAETLALVEAAERFDFDIAWFAEHHFSNYCLCPSPLMMAAYCAGRTEKIRLGTGVVVAPLYEPARLIEEIAFVDLVSEGRLVLGLGSGYQPYEFARFGRDLKDARDHFLELLDVVEMAFTQGRYGYDGRHVRLPETPLAIRPLQKPLPEIYVAGNYGDPVIQRRVLESGYVPFATAGWGPVEALVRFKERYHEGAERLGMSAEGMPLAIQRYVYITDSKADARDAADHVRYTGRLGQSMRAGYFELDGSRLAELPAEGEPSLDEIVDNAVIGDVEACIEKMAREIELLEPTHVSCFVQFGGLSLGRAMRSLELFGERVLPALEKNFGGLAQVGNPVPPQRPAARG